MDYVVKNLSIVLKINPLFKENFEVDIGKVKIKAEKEKTYCDSYFIIFSELTSTLKCGRFGGLLRVLDKV